MKFTLSWLKDHLETEATVADIAAAMTMAGLEVEHVTDPTAAMAPFTVARIVEAVQHPNADRLRVCQVETVDGMKEIVCGAPNARAGLVTIYAPIGAFVPGLGVTLVEKPVRGVVSNGPTGLTGWASPASPATCPPPASARSRSRPSIRCPAPSSRRSRCGSTLPTCVRSSPDG